MAKKIKIKTKKQKHSDADVLFDTALQYYQSGNLQQAEMICRQTVKGEPGRADAWYMLGLISGRMGRYDESVCYIDKAILINPDEHFYYNDIGVSLKFKGSLNEAKERLEKAIELKPDYAEAYDNLGAVLQDMGLFDEAVTNHRKSLLLNPYCSVAYNNLGNTLREQGFYDEAVENFKKALSLKPDYAEAYSNMGLALTEKGALDEAVENCRKALELRPGFAGAFNNLGTAFSDKGIIAEAVNNYKKSLTVDPDFSAAHKNLGMTYLLLKDFERGWREYEWRLNIFKVPPLAKPKWDGSPLNNKTILVYHEQGLGDTLQFVRFLPELHDKSGAKKVMFIPQKGLEQLFRESDLKAEILAPDASAETLEYDTNIHLMSLPLIFRTNFENIPFKGKRYLKANPEKVEWYRKKFFSTTSFSPTPYTLSPAPLKLGIFWQGSPEFRRSKDKAIPLPYFYSFCRMPGVKVYSLQKGYGIEQLNDLPEGIEIVNLGETFNDFSDTAAAIENLDLIITIDTAVAHLSGALGKKTWILHPPFAEWRWHLDMDYSPWYEDVRLFRHKELGKKDWEEMMERVVGELQGVGYRE